MNLAYHFPIIYWNTACLSIDCSAMSDADFDNLVDNDIITIEETDEDKKVNAKMDYAKIASGLDKFKNICSIHTPNINKSKLSFTPNVQDNSILYGLKGICKVTDPAIEEIIINRPFSSLKDFLNRVTKKVVSKDKIINLIKCGAFDELENKPRKEIMEEFIWMTCDPKSKLTLQNANMLIDLELLPQELEYCCDTYKITKELRKHRDAAKLWYCGDMVSIPSGKNEAWKQIIKDTKLPIVEMNVDGETHKVIDSRKWDVFYDNQMSKLREFIKAHHDDLLEKLNSKLFKNEYDKYCRGDLKQWELDSMNFYFSDHPLQQVQKVIEAQKDIVISNINDIVEGASDGQFIIKGKIIPKMKLYTIAGTVIDREKTKGTVTLQCPSGVVTLKVYKDLYATMSQVIGDVSDSGEKDIEQDSFFEKGVHLLVTGIQRGVTFVPKTYKNTGVNSIMRIIVDDNNNFIKLEEKI